MYMVLDITHMIKINTKKVKTQKQDEVRTCSTPSRALLKPPDRVRRKHVSFIKIHIESQLESGKEWCRLVLEPPKC